MDVRIHQEIPLSFRLMQYVFPVAWDAIAFLAKSDGITVLLSKVSE
jgi:hypothetical protein